MSLQPGQTLTHHEILAPLGKGGMGEVWRARDSRLDREVAIKVLPEHLAGDADRLQRFEREAKTLATLSHANVAQVYGIDQVGETCFIVMELVPGEDLSERVARGALPLAETLDVCGQIAAGLEAAHEAGVIHRDLKPANVRVTPEGVVKLLDFGLAKPGGSGSGSGGDTSEPDSFLATEEGVVLGTPTYMSPEQARGRAVDRRTDLWAFGCVLYECLTGQRAFRGDSKAELLAAVLEREPDWDALPGDTPPHLRLLLERCLEKDPRARLRDAGDARWELEHGASRQVPAESVAPPSRRLTRLLGALVLGLLAGSYAMRAWRDDASAASPTLRLEAFRRITHHEGSERGGRLTANGDTFVYSARLDDQVDIYRQRVGGARPLNLTATPDESETEPALSPDETAIAYTSTASGGGLFLMGATGESPRRLTDFGFAPSWSPDAEHIVFAEATTTEPLSRGILSDLHVLTLESGELRPLGVDDGLHPSWSPDGRWIAYWGIDTAGQRDIWVVEADGGTPRQLTDDAAVDWSPSWTPDGRGLLFASDRSGVMSLWMGAFDTDSGTLEAPQPLLHGTSGDVAEARLSADGSRLVFTVRTAESHAVRQAFDVATRSFVGQRERIPNSRGVGPTIPSPDGEWIASSTGSPAEDLMLVRIDGSERRRLFEDADRDRAPSWSADGERLLFFSNRSGNTYRVWSCRTDGSDLRPHTSADQSWIVPSLSPDERHLVVSSMNGTLGIVDEFRWEGELDVRTGGDGLPESASVLPGCWSPDSKWVLVHERFGGFRSMGIADAKLEGYEELLPEAMAATWLPDSSGFIFMSPGGEVEIFDLETRSRQVLGKTEDPMFDSIQFFSTPRLSSDGRWGYATAMELEIDIWTADVVQDARED